MISREREKKREKKKKTSLLLLKSMRVFFCMRRRTFPTVMQICAIGSSGPSGAPSTPILIYFTLLYFTSSYNFCVFNNNEEIKISCVCCCSFLSSFLPFSFFSIAFGSFDRRKERQNQIPSTSRHKNFAHCPPLFLFHNQRTTPQINIYGAF